MQIGPQAPKKKAAPAAPAAQIPGSNVQEEMFGLANSEVVRAGSLYYAVLDTSIDSDVTQPVLATIVSGPLAGSKIMGRFKRSEDKLALAFDRIQIQDVKNTTTINLFAVDVNTVNNVTVNRHLMLKYGSMFASSFLSGVGDVILKFGNQSTTNRDANGAQTTTSNPLDDAITTVG